jgi:hypothetical protein
MTQSMNKGKPGKPLDSSNAPSSPGDSPVEMNVKDVTPDDASWRDRTPRKIASDDAEERDDALLDEAVDLTFPASDPIATTGATRIERDKRNTGTPKPGSR